VKFKLHGVKKPDLLSDFCFLECIADVDETVGELFLEEKQPTDEQLVVSMMGCIVYDMFVNCLMLINLQYKGS